jgi:hypothetical protein
VLTLPIKTETVLAIRCPECGKMEYHKIQRFLVGRSGSYDVKCDCGTDVLSISTQDRSQYSLKLACVYCGDIHQHNLSGRRVWGPVDVVDLYCPETDLELGCVGQEILVRQAVDGREEELESLVSEFGQDEYFFNSQVMHKVLRFLQDISEKGSLYCQCGNRQIGVDIFPDRVELYCNKCNSVNIIYAENEDDLLVIQNLEEIQLLKNGFECLDSLSRTRGPKNTSGRGRKNKP